MYTPEYDPEKMRETVLHVANLSRNPQMRDTEAIAAVVYLADTQAYRRYGKSITGASYRHMHGGPMPADFPQLLHNMSQDGDHSTSAQPSFTRIRSSVVPRRHARLDVFSPDELDVISSVMTDCQEMSRDDILSHVQAELGYRATTMYDTIPYETSWISSEPLTAAEIELGQLIAAEL